MINLLYSIQHALEEIKHGWTSVDKAHLIAAEIIALRPILSVEIGVYAGKGLISMALAHNFIDYGQVIGIDPYSPEASAAGQDHPNDKKFWGELDHQNIYELCCENIMRYGVSNRVKLIREKSDNVEPPDGIGLLRIDGNHGEQAARDFDRFAPKVKIGGILHADDIKWTGGSIDKAVSNLLLSGQFRELCPIDDGVVLQRIAV
jgi:predicted O-methyltransferase YrrM